MLAENYLLRFGAKLLRFIKRLVNQKVGVAIKPGAANYGQYFQFDLPITACEMPVSR
jgi:hypothetical protein